MASGDVVNTAARLQSAAPVNGVIVDETTYRATRNAVDYRESTPVEAKGKSEPITVWEANEARARLGSEVLDHVAGDLVGRERELTALRAAFDRAREESSPQLVTLVGVPGIGKSRLLYELSRVVDAMPELTTWRQGRCLAYGDGITFWALAEIVKAQAGIDEADDDATVAEKLRQVAAETVDPADADWVAARLRPLAGTSKTVSELGGDRGVEAFAAWRRFFEELAAQRPLVLVFEDLQWADDGLLDVRRRARRLDERRADARRLHRAAGAAGAAPELGRREAQRLDGRARATLRRRHRAPDGHPARASGAAGRGPASPRSTARAATPSMRSSSPSSTSSEDPPRSCPFRRRSRGSSAPASTICRRMRRR